MWLARTPRAGPSRPLLRPPAPGPGHRHHLLWTGSGRCEAVIRRSASITLALHNVSLVPVAVAGGWQSPSSRNWHSSVRLTPASQPRLMSQPASQPASSVHSHCYFTGWLYSQPVPRPVLAGIRYASVKVGRAYIRPPILCDAIGFLPGLTDLTGSDWI